MGGTFDPIHNGHLAIAEAARNKLDLNYVIFIPAGQPWMKSHLSVSAAEDRLEMVRLAISSYPYFRLSRIEIERQGPSYTVDTLETLREEIGEDSRLFLVLGWDTVAQLPKWYHVIRLVELCDIVAIPRPGYTAPHIEDLDRQIPGIAPHVVVMDSPCIDISATDIRDRIARGMSISGLVPETVAGYIREKRLYQS